jgi:hypothetical protein
VKALIVIVPDPVRTHMPLRFDRAIDAVQLAAASMNYLIDRYWLPWDLELKTDWDDYDSYKSAKIERKQEERQPALLIFRRQDKPDESKPTILLVFLVSETPTAGINGDQFDRAVCYADLLNEADRSSKGDCSSEQALRASKYVVGPTFSASFASLDGLIRDYPQKTFVIKETAWDLLANQAAADPQRQQFVRPVDEATQQFRDLLARYRYVKEPCREEKKHEIAILSEASTAFGASFEPEVKSNRCIDIFRYPREIASLRNEYGALNSQNAAAANPSDGPRPSLSVNLTDTTNRSDEPPNFSKPQVALSQEATLMAYAAEMQRNHYSYIGISGSNPLDVVFLASFLRSAVPNARLFSFNADFLMQHEPDSAPYIGTLSIAAYPLLYPPLNRVGEQSFPGERTRLPFTSQNEAIIYNAAVCLVREMLNDIKLGYLSERRDCAEASNPPLWLTTFGAGGHWPIQVLGPGEAPGPDLKDLPLPSAWKATCILLCALAVLHVLIALGVPLFSSKFQALKLGTVAPAWQLLGIHAASATLALAIALVALSAWRWNLWTGTAMGVVWILPGACWGLTRKYFCWWREDRIKPQEERRLRDSRSPCGMAWELAACAGIWIAAGALSYLWCTLRYNQDGHYGEFFSFRALNLASMVSPLTPMLPLLAAIYLGSIFYVWHLVFNDRIRPRLNPSGEKPPCPNKLRPGWRSEKRIVRAVNDDAKSAAIGGAIMGLWFMVFHQSQFELVERPSFETLFIVLFGLVILLILVSGYRLAWIWQELRRFLLEVNRQRRRVRGVLLQLKSEGSSWASIWFYGSEDPDWDYMVRSLNVLQELWDTPTLPESSNQVDRQITSIRHERRVLQDERRGALRAFRVSENDGKLERAMSHAQGLFAKTLNEALDHLNEILAHPAVGEEGIKRQRLLERYVALRWVAFIRGVIGRIRLLIIFLAVAFSLAMISLVIYSFEPHRELLWSVTALFLVIGLVIIKVLIQMHRDPILSYITGTKPGQLDFAFYLHVVTLGVGPLVTLLATHFPGIGRYVISFLQPGLEALK